MRNIQLFFVYKGFHRNQWAPVRGSRVVLVG